MKTFEERLAHPTPQFMREDWIDLCGIWLFDFDKENKGLEEAWFKEHLFENRINVPYVYQSELSGVMKTEEAKVVWYKREVVLEPRSKEKMLLHIEASDYTTMIWVNGQFVDSHEGGFTPFIVDITTAVEKGINYIVIRVEDTTSPTQILGKQSWKKNNFLCWYTKTTGIWQPIWIEYVPENYIEHFKITPDIDTNSVKIETMLNSVCVEGTLTLSIYFKNRLLNSTSITVRHGSTKVKLDIYDEEADFCVELWSPETPNLYDLEICFEATTGEVDKVSSYFGMRKIATEDNRILLNNIDFYQKLVLNQGYCKKGLMTAESIDQVLEDMNRMKKCGFNGMRIHQKIETHRFLFLCDYVGLVTWAEMPSFYRYNMKAKDGYWATLREVLNKHYNHPSVITWVLFNESWGINSVYNNTEQQRFVDAAYYYTKDFDNTRLVVGNDGWEHAKTDILTIHEYTQEANVIYNTFANVESEIERAKSKTSQKSHFAQGYAYSNQPIIISEFGGVAYSEEDKKEGWGYGKRPKNKEEVMQRIEMLIQAINKLDNICGFCYTQWTDVEQEVNGILNADHEEKLQLQKIKDIMKNINQSGYIFE